MVIVAAGCQSCIATAFLCAASVGFVVSKKPLSRQVERKGVFEVSASRGILLQNGPQDGLADTSLEIKCGRQAIASLWNYGQMSILLLQQLQQKIIHIPCECAIGRQTQGSRQLPVSICDLVFELGKQGAQNPSRKLGAGLAEAS